MKQTFNFEDLKSIYESITTVIRCKCEFATELVGGMAPDKDGLRAFAKHHLQLTTEAEITSAVDRMLKEEIGEKDVTPEMAELGEKINYGVKVLRKTEGRPWLGDWMVKAHYKQSASILHLFEGQYKGNKKNFAEGGKASAFGISLIEKDHPERIYLFGPDGKRNPEVYFKEFSGKVNGPNGSVSIIQNCECVAPGTRFSYEYRVYPFHRVTMEDLKRLVSMGMTVGLGSARSLERGKYRIINCEIEVLDNKKEKEEKKEARGTRPGEAPRMVMAEV